MNDKKEQIITAAIEVFSKIGFSHATIQDIATAAGIGKGTVYSYFPSKQEILIDACESLIGNCATELLNACSTITDTQEILSLFITLFFEEFTPRQSEECFLFYEMLVLQASDEGYAEKIGSVLKTRCSQMEEFILSVYKTGVEKGELKEIENAKEFFQSFLAMIDGLIFQYSFRPESFDLKSFKECQLEKFRNILFR